MRASSPADCWNGRRQGAGSRIFVGDTRPGRSRAMGHVAAGPVSAGARSAPGMALSPCAGACDRDSAAQQKPTVGSDPMRVTEEVIVLVVGFRNPGDVRNCIRALAGATAEPGFEVFITENGGPSAMDALVRVLVGDGSLCQMAADGAIPTDPRLVRRRQRLRWCRPDGGVRMWINLAETRENLGYAGGVNAWLRPLLAVPGWQGASILNPDAEPSPRALAELVSHAATRHKGMVGSRLLPHAGIRAHPLARPRVAEADRTDRSGRLSRAMRAADGPGRTWRPGLMRHRARRCSSRAR